MVENKEEKGFFKYSLKMKVETSMGHSHKLQEVWWETLSPGNIDLPIISTRLFGGVFLILVILGRKEKHYLEGWDGVSGWLAPATSQAQTWEKAQDCQGSRSEWKEGKIQCQETQVLLDIQVNGATCGKPYLVLQSN